MHPLWAIVVFIAGVLIVVEATEKFVEGLLRSSAALGLSPLAMGILFGGFDAENLAVGIAGVHRGLPGVAWGTIVGSAFFLVTVALGLAAVLIPVRVAIPGGILLLGLLSPVPLLLLARDGVVSRHDGALLLVLFALALAGVLRFARRGGRAYWKKGEEVEPARPSRGREVLVMLLALVAISVGAEIVARGARGIVAGFGISDTLFGMVFVAASVSLEEVAREVIPMRRGYPDISVGNILGTLLFFFLLNAGVVTLVDPLPATDPLLRLCAALLAGALALVAIFIRRGRVGRSEGVALLGIYLLSLILIARS